MTKFGIKSKYSKEKIFPLQNEIPLRLGLLSINLPIIMSRRVYLGRIPPGELISLAPHHS